MSFMAFCLRLACVLLVTGLASSALAQYKHPIAAGFRNVNGGSNMRFQIGNGLPVPITGAGSTLGAPCLNTAPGQGNCEDRIFPYPGAFGLPGGFPPATIQQPSTGPSTGRSLYLHPGLFLGGGFPVNIGVFKANPAVFQVKTNILLKIPPLTSTGGGPGKGLTLSKGGRTGPSTVSFCPGLTTVTQFGSPNPNFSLNPNCTAAAVGKAIGVPGRMVYSKTKNQFGGAFQPGKGVFGTADVALVNKYDGALCKGAGCVVSFVYASPLPTGVNGGPFGGIATSIGKKAKKYYVSGITSKGVITAVGAYAGKAKYTNVPTSVGGPWTTGMITMTATATAAGGSEMFTRTGSDARVFNAAASSLAGNLSLVSGAVSQRGFTGPNANRGWMTLTLPEPGALASAAGALLALVVCHRLARRRSG